MLSCDFNDFFSFNGIIAHKVAKTWFVLHETWNTTLFGIRYCVEEIKILKKIDKCYKLRAKLRF